MTFKKALLISTVKYHATNPFTYIGHFRRAILQKEDEWQIRIIIVNSCQIQTGFLSRQNLLTTSPLHNSRGIYLNFNRVLLLGLKRASEI